MVTLTLGGNDADFVGDAKTCVTPGKNEYDCLSPDPTLLKNLGYDTTPQSNDDGTLTSVSTGTSGRDPTVPPPDLSPQNVESKLSVLGAAMAGLSIHDRLVLLYRTIHQLAPQARILVLGYPRFFPSDDRAVEHFSSQETAWVNERIALTDDVIHDAAERSGVAEYVDVYNAFNNHEAGTGDFDFTVDKKVLPPATADHT